MILSLIRGKFELRSFTLAIIFLLFFVGVVVAFDMKYSEVELFKAMHKALLWGWWRGFAYIGLVAYWPKLVKNVLRRHTNKTITKASRWPLLLIVILYEGLIAWNPLAWLFNWFGQG